MTNTLGRLLSFRRREIAGCGFLRADEVDAWLEDRLSAGRRGAFADHRGGCDRCALLAADLDVFHDVATRGPLAAEMREFEGGRRVTEAWLRQEAADRGLARRPAWPAGLNWSRAAGLAAAAVIVGVLLLPRVGRDAGPAGVELPDGTLWTVSAPAFSAPPVTRGPAGAEELETLWSRLGEAWAASDWSAAHLTADRILEIRGDSHDAALYAGAALVLQARYDEAVDRLELARRLAEERLGGAGAGVTYYLGVARLATGDSPAAREALAESRDHGGPYGERAAELLGRLGD